MISRPKHWQLPRAKAEKVGDSSGAGNGAWNSLVTPDSYFTMLEQYGWKTTSSHFYAGWAKWTYNGRAYHTRSLPFYIMVAGQLGFANNHAVWQHAGIGGAMWSASVPNVEGHQTDAFMMGASSAGRDSEGNVIEAFTASYPYKRNSAYSLRCLTQ